MLLWKAQQSHSGGLLASASFSLPPFHPPHLLFFLYLFNNQVPLRDSSIKSDFAASLKGQAQGFSQAPGLPPAYTRLYIKKTQLNEQHPEYCLIASILHEELNP